MPSSEEHQNNCEDLQALVAGYFCGALTSNLMVLGERLGLFHALSELGPSTPDDVAAHLELAPRYVTEWCRQQAASKIISCDEDADKFWLSEAQKDILIREYGENASPFYSLGGLESLPSLNAIADKNLPTMFRTGEGLPYDDYGHGLACGTCRELGVWVRHFLVDRLRSLPGVSKKLDSGCLVADVGCGCGEAVLTVAAAFPASTVHGFDISEHALQHALKQKQKRGITNAEFRNPGTDESSMPEAFYDLVMTHDAIHDMSTPMEVMKSVFKAMKPGGVWVIGDMQAGQSHGENIQQNPIAGFSYGFSCHLCLPSAMGAKGEGAALGTLGLSKSLAEEMLKDAGFASVDVLDWDHPLNRYYLATKAS